MHASLRFLIKLQWLCTAHALKCILQRTTKHYKLRRSGEDNDFRTLHRFDKEKVEWLSNYFLGESDETRRTFLRVVGDPGFQSGVGEDVGIHQTIDVRCP